MIPSKIPKRKTGIISVGLCTKSAKMKAVTNRLMIVFFFVGKVGCSRPWKKNPEDITGRRIPAMNIRAIERLPFRLSGEKRYVGAGTEIPKRSKVRTVRLWMDVIISADGIPIRKLSKIHPNPGFFPKKSFPNKFSL